MEEKRFNPKKLNKLNNPERLIQLPPEFIKEKVGLSNPKSIIDIGAGTGFFSIPFAEFFKESTVYACDISDIMINWMKENISPKYKNILPLEMKDNSIPLKDNMADFVFMINLHHELGNPTKLLDECNRLLKQGGKIAISDWKKEKMEQGPSFELRYEVNVVKDQLITSGFDKIKIYNELSKNYLIVAEK